MSLLNDITNNFKKRMAEGVDRVSDKEAEDGWDELEDKDMDNDGDTDKTDSYLYKRQGMVAKMDENALGIDEPYYVEIAVRDARKAVEAIKDVPMLSKALRNKTLKPYGTNVFATDDEDIMQMLSDILLDNNIDLLNHKGLDEMSTTAGVPGYMTPKAFGDADEDTYTQGGMERVKETNRIFKPMGRTKRMESKSSYKSMMAEMYGVNSELNEAANPELDKMVTAFVDKIADRYGYPTSDAIMAMFEALKRKGFLHKSVNYKSPSNYSVDEAVSYRDYKKDETASPSHKVNKGIQEVNAMLAEIEKIIHNNLRLKTEMGVNSGQFWKKTSGRIGKINERIVRISNKLKELSK
jgi:hypothetical protein